MMIVRLCVNTYIYMWKSYIYTWYDIQIISYIYNYIEHYIFIYVYIYLEKYRNIKSLTGWKDYKRS